MDDLQGILEASPDAALIVDETGVIRLANRRVSETLGYSPAELEGRMVEDLLLEADREQHVRYRREYMASPEPRPMGRELDLYARHKDGSSVPVEISLGPIERDGDLYVVATITDITNRKQREERLQRQNERLDKFASVVSHDLRNPLNVAQGRLELAREECESMELDRAAVAVDRSLTLIEDLLALAREGEAVTEFEAVELGAVADACWRTVGVADAELRIETARTIRADESRLKQLFENLFSNAIEHGVEPVTITVGDLDDGFYVADDGPGIPDADRDRVFEEGYSTEADGTGFGLNIVQRIIEAHGWAIRVRESASGGARFEITGVEQED